MFSARLYLRQLKNTKLAGIGICVIFALTNGILSFISAKSPTAEPRLFQGNFLILLSVVLSIYSFSFLWKRNESDFYHSLPQKRICVFNCIVSAIASWMLIAFLLAFAFGAAAFLCHGHSVPIAENIKLFFGLYFSSLTIAAGSILVANLSGTLLQAVMYVLFVLPAPWIIAASFLNRIIMVNWTIVPEASLLSFFTGEKFALYHALYSEHFSISLILLFLAKATILLVISALLFKKRESQDAEKPSNSINFFLIIICGTFLFGIFDVTYNTFPAFSELFIAIILGTLFAFLFKLVIFKSSKKSATAIFCFGGGLVVMFLLQIAATGVCTIYKKTVPDSAEIERVTISILEYDQYAEQEALNPPKEGIDYFDDEFSLPYSYDGLYTTDQHSIEVIAAILHRDTYYGRPVTDPRQAIILKIKLKTGREIVREVYIGTDDLVTLVSGIRKETINKDFFTPSDYNELDYFSAYYQKSFLGKKDNVTTIDNELLYNTFLDEYKALSPAQIAQCQVKNRKNTITISFLKGNHSETLGISSELFPKTTKLFYVLYSGVSKEAAQEFISKITNTSMYINFYIFPVESTSQQEGLDSPELIGFNAEPKYIEQLIKVITPESLSDTSDLSQLYYITWHTTHEEYILSLDEEIINLLKSFK